MHTLQVTDFQPVSPNSVSEVFSFTTTPTCVQVDSPLKVARFGYTIPAGAPAELAGQPVAVRVVDNGVPGTNDTYEHNYAAALNSCVSTGTPSAYQQAYRSLLET